MLWHRQHSGIQYWKVGVSVFTKHSEYELGQIVTQRIRSSEFSPVNNNFLTVMGLAFWSIKKIFLVIGN